MDYRNYIMKLAPSIAVSAVLVGAVSFALTQQSTGAPNTYLQYASLEIAEEQTYDSAYSMVLYGREQTERLYGIGPEETPQLPLVLAAADITSVQRNIDSAESEQTRAPLQLHGLQRTLDLNDIAALWQDYLALPDKLRPGQPIYVIYRDISADFSQANVSIGSSTQAGNAIDPLQPQGWLPLLQEGKHPDTALADAWLKIDNRRELLAVIEKHQPRGGEYLASVFALYR